MAEQTDPADAAVASSVELYPHGLLRWAGTRDGGVRRLFQAGAGRPTGGVIETPLLGRLRRWAESVASSRTDLQAPRIVLLVGGPGNGKTDAVESCVGFLDQSFGFGGMLLADLQREFERHGDFIPRQATVDLVAIDDRVAGLTPLRKLSVVQDATQDDSERAGVSPPELLLLDLEAALADPDVLYLACVNRGIIADALSSGWLQDRDHLRQLLTTVTKAVVPGYRPPACWPLEGWTDVAVWPMDAESLVLDATGESETAAFQVLSRATDLHGWVENCPAGEMCPFCTNRRMLSEPAQARAFLRLLRWYELASGKRWTFRDLFSLLSYLLAGPSTELDKRGRPRSPCEWAAEQTEIIAGPPRKDDRQKRAPYLLLSRLYHQALFARWPRLHGARKSFRTIAPTTQFEPALAALEGWFWFLDRRQVDHVSPALRGLLLSLGDTLDPAGAESELLLGNGHSLGELDDQFSQSVDQGFDAFKALASPIERTVLRQLAEADRVLSSEKIKTNHREEARAVQRNVRSFACRMVRRHLGVREGLTRESGCLSNYETLLAGDGNLAVIRSHFQKLLHDGGDHFRVPLTTTFGQPLPPSGRQVTLVTGKQKVRVESPERTGTRPGESLPFLLINRHPVPLTYSLYRALVRLDKGLSVSSLPQDLVALLDATRAHVGGAAVRSAEALEDDAEIVLGDTGTRLTVDVLALAAGGQP